MSDRKIYFVKINSNDELDLIEKLLFFYSSTLVMRGKTRLILNDKLIKILAIYFKYGYNKESKKMVLDMTGIDNRLLNTSNFNLTEQGYLVPDLINIRIKTLNKELQDLKEFYDNTIIEENKNFLVKFK
jgi:hypothetical protein